MFTLHELRLCPMASLHRLCWYVGLRVAGLSRDEMIAWLQLATAQRGPA